jgi:formylmethanofuran dehydrogenase subunit C
MFTLEGSDHYETIIERLVDEFVDELEDDTAVLTDIASGVLSGTTVVEGEATVYHSAEVWGGKIEATGGEALDPYEVIMYSDADFHNHPPDTSTEKLARACLVKDIAEEQRDRVNTAESQ